MFVKLLHGLHAVAGAVIKYLQHWTNIDVPDGTRTLHNFKDGQGKVPAVPYDETTTSNAIESVKTDDTYVYNKDEVTQSNNILRVKLHTELASGNDNLTNKTGIESAQCVPEPVVFEIQNEVPDKIEKIVPIKTQALPGQDYIFEIFYVKDYNYIEGDIMTVFGSWGNYAKLSKNGKYLTVNSYADLSVRLILTPAPQDWIPEQPDPSIIQQQGDRILNTIPRDGAKSIFDIEQAVIEDNFYNVTIENQATTFVTNGEFSNGKYYNVDAKTKKITIPMTFAEGFDENAIYWKCYDDPKSATPVTGYYPSKDYNEEFGPLPDGFRKLRYLYGDGNPYIDLGIKLKKDYKVKILMEVSNNTSQGTRALFGARNKNSTDYNDFYYDDRTDGAYACYIRYVGYETIGFQRGTKRVYSQSNISSIYGSPKWYYSTGTSFEVQNYDGTLIRRNTIAEAQNIDTEWNCYLFTVNDKGNPYVYGTQGYMYRCEIWDENDNLIMRLIPAKNLDTNSCGMYDIVNNKFYYNKRLMTSFSGPEFYVWQKQMQTSDHNNILTLNDISPVSDYNKEYILPEEYFKLFGVYFPESYIDTNYKLKKDDRVEIIAKIDNNTNNGYRVLFGSRTNYSNSDSYFFFTRYSYSNYFCYGKNGGETSSSASVYDTIFKLVCTPTQATWYVDDVQKGQITRGGTPTDSTYTCWLGCGNNSNSVDSYNYCTIYSFKVFDKDDNLKLNLVPCIRKIDNEIGFYDTVSNTFLKRTGGNTLQARNISPIVKKQLIIENITKDINLGIIKNPSFDEPFKLEEFEDLEHLKQIDEITYAYEFLDASITDYFYVVSTTNNAPDYVSVDASYRAANLGTNVSFTLTYKQGYDNYDITCTPNTTATVTLGKTHYITYNELDIPADYTPVKGITNSNISQLYFKTGYFPKWDDKIVCYAAISNNYYTYPCYIFGSRNGENNKSFTFSRTNYDGMMAYDRCCGIKNIRNKINDELFKITADNNGCETDFAYTKTKIDTQMYTIQPQPDYNPDITLPSGYTKLNGVYFRESYINTNYKVKADDRIEVFANVDSNTNSSYRVLFGARTSSFSADNYFFFTRFNGYQRACYGKNSKETQASNFLYSEPVKVIAEPNKVSWYNKNGELKGEINVTGTAIDCNYNMWIGCGNNSNNVDSWNYATYYYFKIFDKNDNLILNYIPAKRDSDGVIGFYDTVSSTFITRTSGNYALEARYINDSIYPNNDYEMYLFNCNQSNQVQYSFYGSIYKFTVYSGEGVIKHNFVPVKRLSDSKLGFFDTIKQAFFEPINGTPSEASAPTYKGNVIVSNIPDDTYITFTKNNNARKPITLEEGYENDYERKPIDELEWNYEFRDSTVIDWFNTVKYINNIGRVCSVAGAVATYYNVPRIGDNTRFPITYNIGYDHDNILATATEGATVEITDALKLVYEKIPDDYIQVAGLYNENTNTYFKPLNNSGDTTTPYLVKATDSIKIWLYDMKYDYTRWYFGSGSNETSNTCILCSRYEGSNNIYYARNVQRKGLPGPANEVVMFDCKPNGITYTNGYDTYNYTLDNTPTDCVYPLHIFGACMYNSTYHYSSFKGTIYKFQIYDDNGVKYNFIPCKRKSDNVLGLYDTVGDRFYLPEDGSVYEAAQPKLKGSVIVRNITTDTDVTISEKVQPTLDIDFANDSVEHTHQIMASSITDYWHWISVNNTTNGLITLTNANYGGNCYICSIGSDTTITVSYQAGYSSSDFIVSEGTLTNNGIVLTNVTADKTITIMKNDYHDPQSDTEDDLGIFTSPDFSDYSQYRIVEGSDVMLTSYAFINSEPAAMSDKEIFEFNIGEIDLLAWTPSNIPGDHVKTKISCPMSNMQETVQNVTINSKQMYKHTITLRTQIKLENGKSYIFKVRDRSDTGKLIAYAKDTGAVNLVNSQGEYYIEDNTYYFNWNEPNKYIVKGNKTIYFEINGVKL